MMVTYKVQIGSYETTVRNGIELDRLINQLVKDNKIDFETLSKGITITPIRLTNLEEP